MQPTATFPTGNASEIFGGEADRSLSTAELRAWARLAPASSTSWSPGWALRSAALRSSPLASWMSFPSVAANEISSSMYGAKQKPPQSKIRIKTIGNEK